MTAPETRPALSQQNFDAVLKRSRPSHWLTGEERLIHVREVMSIEEWSSYGSTGNLLLTQPQRYLMMWSDIVGQTSNGGLDQFFENFAKTLDFAAETVAALEWSDLRKRFDEAFAQYVCDRDGQPATVSKWLSDRASEQEEHRLEAKEFWLKQKGAPFDGSDEQLDGLVHVLAFRGVITIQGWEYPEINLFNKWFYAQSTRDTSEEMIGRFIRNHKDELVRIVG